MWGRNRIDVWMEIKIRCVDGYKQHKNCNIIIIGKNQSMMDFAAEQLRLNAPRVQLATLALGA